MSPDPGGFEKGVARAVRLRPKTKSIKKIGKNQQKPTKKETKEQNECGRHCNRVVLLLKRMDGRPGTSRMEEVGRVPRARSWTGLSRYDAEYLLFRGRALRHRWSLLNRGRWLTLPKIVITI